MSCSGPSVCPEPRKGLIVMASMKAIILAGAFVAGAANLAEQKLPELAQIAIKSAL